MQEIQHKFEIAGSAHKIFSALSDGQHIRNWWTRDSDLNPLVGAKGTFVWSKHGWKVKVRIHCWDFQKTGRKSVKTILSTGLDRQCDSAGQLEIPGLLPHQNIRGQEYYQCNDKEESCA